MDVVQEVHIFVVNSALTANLWLTMVNIQLQEPTCKCGAFSAGVPIPII